MSIEFYKKQAKRLRKQVAQLQPDALIRVKKVFPRPPKIFHLVKAQHVVAVEHGFYNWTALRRACSGTMQQSAGKALLPMDLAICKPAYFDPLVKFLDSDPLSKILNSNVFKLMKQQQALDHAVNPIRNYTDRIRKLLQSLGNVPDEAFQYPIRMMSIYRIVGGKSAILSKAIEQAQHNAKYPRWAVDFGTWVGQLNNAEKIMQLLQEQSIPFWQGKGNLGVYHSALKFPKTAPDLYQEVCETFGVPDENQD